MHTILRDGGREREREHPIAYAHADTYIYVHTVLYVFICWQSTWCTLSNHSSPGQPNKVYTPLMVHNPHNGIFTSASCKYKALLRESCCLCRGWSCCPCGFETTLPQGLQRFRFRSYTLRVLLEGKNVPGQKRSLSNQNVKSQSHWSTALKKMSFLGPSLILDWGWLVAVLLAPSSFDNQVTYLRLNQAVESIYVPLAFSLMISWLKSLICFLTWRVQHVWMQMEGLSSLVSLVTLADLRFSAFWS